MKVKNILIMTFLVVIVFSSICFGATVEEIEAYYQENLSSTYPYYAIYGPLNNSYYSLDVSQTPFYMDDIHFRLLTVGPSQTGKVYLSKTADTVVMGDMDYSRVVSSITYNHAHLTDYSNNIMKSSNHDIIDLGTDEVFFSPPTLPVAAMAKGLTITQPMGMILPVGLGILGLVLSYKILPRLLYKFL